MTQRDSGRMLQLLLVCCLACTTTLAQTYPARPIRLIVPSSAGSGSDFVARIVALGMTQTLGQQFVIDNRAGGGNIAAELGAPPALPCHFKRSSCLATIKAQESAEPFVTFDENPRSLKLLQLQ